MNTKYDIKILSTGGTIDKVVYSYDQAGYVVGDPQVDRILHQANLTITFSLEAIIKKDSLDITDDDRQLIRRRVIQEECNQIIITHGTDTISHTARELKDVLGKTIVFTGAMLPARFIDSDAIFNIGGAVLAVQLLPPGLYLVIHGRVFNPFETTKNRERAVFQHS